MGCKGMVGICSRRQAGQDPQIAGVVFPMLTFSTSLGEARLCETCLSGCAEVEGDLGIGCWAVAVQGRQM